MWELDHEEGWAPKNWGFQTVVFEKTLESPLDYKIKSVKRKGNQPRVYIGRTDAEAPILWPPDTKSQLTGKDPDAEKDWKQEEKGMTDGWMVSPTQWTWAWVSSGKDREAWSTAVHDVAKGRTWLIDQQQQPSPGVFWHTPFKSRVNLGLRGAQQAGTHLPMWGTEVQLPPWEDPTHSRATSPHTTTTKPALQSPRAATTEPATTEACVSRARAHNKRSPCGEKATHCREEWPPHWNQRKPVCSSEDKAQPKINKFFLKNRINLKHTVFYNLLPPFSHPLHPK